MKDSTKKYVTRSGREFGVEAPVTTWSMLDDSPDVALVVGEVWDQNVYLFDETDLRYARTVVDVGAHVGSFTLRAAALGARRIVAVEPVAANVERLRANLDLNAYALSNGNVDVEVVEAAVGNPELSGRMVGASTGARFEPDLDGTIMPTTLDDLVGRFGPVDILKLDVEGAEYDAVAAASDETFWSVRRIVMETHTPPESGLFGGMVERLADFYSLRIIGQPRHGGMLYGDRS